MQSYWHRQTVKEPLFPDLIWSRPEHTSRSGKLLMVGGNVHSFAAVGQAYAAATKAGIGTTRFLLPDALQKAVSAFMPDAEYAPATPSGSFGRQALATLLDTSRWADGILLTGDFGRNAETAIMLEKYLADYNGLLIATGDTLDYFTQTPQALLNRPSTVIVPTFSQLQKTAVKARFPKPFTSQMDLLRTVDNLHEFSKTHDAALVVIHQRQVLVADTGEVGSTALSELATDQETVLAAQAAVWWIQNPTKRFQSLVTSVLF